VAMVAMNADRTAVVEAGSIEARWMVNDGDVSEYLKHAKKHPRMQELMRAEAEKRLEDEKLAAENAALEKAARARRLKQLGYT
jgi:ABC-type dipeptide/oligopeptide/nickel transport system ATPase component